MNILIAEDSELMQQRIKNIVEPFADFIDFSDNGFTTFLKVHEGLENQNPFDLLLLDLNMPDFRGEVFIEQMKESARKNNISVLPKIIVVSAELDNAKMVELISAGVQDYIAKPFEDDDLVQKIRNYFPSI